MNSTIPEMSDDKRTLNVGKEIELKKFGKVSVRELSLESLVKLSSELIAVAQVIDFASAASSEDKANSGFVLIQTILSNPKTLEAARLIAASSTGKDPSDFEDMGLSDWLKLTRAIQLVMDWEEIKELFTEIAPLDSLRELTSQVRSQDTSTSSPVSTDGGPIIP